MFWPTPNTTTLGHQVCRHRARARHRQAPGWPL